MEAGTKKALIAAAVGTAVFVGLNKAFGLKIPLWICAISIGGTATGIYLSENKNTAK